MEMIFSCISIFLSVFFSIVTIINSVKDKKLNMRNNYYDIFKEYLTVIIPEMCSKFISEESFKCNDEVGKEFEKLVGELKDKIKFLYYMDYKKYKAIENALVNLEEEIILLPTRKENVKKHITKFKKNVKKLYRNINKHFS